MEKINLNNISLSYETMGQGSDVLLLHGFPSNMYMWNEIKNKLVETGYRVTIVEQRGYPLSRLENFDVLSFNIEELSKDIEELIIKLKLDQNLTIVGHDWGSIVAWAIISREKINISKLISICGGTEFPTTAVYNNLTYKEKPHYISSFQNFKESADIIDNNPK
jgi:pimeloyl-ACP methyl ester carboxylesterase